METIDEQFFNAVECYHVRITHPDVSGLDLLAYLEQFYRYVIVSEEYSEKRKEHLHCLLGSNKNSYIEDQEPYARLIIKDYCAVRFPDSKSKGNKLYTLTLARNNQQLRKYVLKDGKYWYTGFTEETIKQAFMKSFTKSYQKLFRELLNKYAEGEISAKEYKLKYLEMKLLNFQSIDLNWISRHFLTIDMYSKDKEKLSRNVNQLYEIIEEINNRKYI